MFTYNESKLLLALVGCAFLRGGVFTGGDIPQYVGAFVLLWSARRFIR